MKRFKYAFKGLFQLFIIEKHLMLHVVAAILVVGAGLYYTITALEWLSITISIGMVLIAEAFNTVIEEIMNFIHPDFNQKVGIIKDMGAGAVLISAIIALICGMMVFIPYIIK